MRWGAGVPVRGFIHAKGRYRKARHIAWSAVEHLLHVESIVIIATVRAGISRGFMLENRHSVLDVSIPKQVGNIREVHVPCHWSRPVEVVNPDTAAE